MDRYRIGEDLDIRWTLLYGDGRPFSLEGYSYRLKCLSGRGEVTVPSCQFIASGNVISWTFPARFQIAYGSYHLCLDVFKEEALLTRFFYRDAFSLSCHGDGLHSVEITSKASLATTANGMYDDLSKLIGDLSQLETADKSDLVHAINSAAKTGSGGSSTGGGCDCDIDDELSLVSDSPVMNKVITAAMEDLRAQVGALYLGVKFTLGSSSSCVYKNESASVTLTATLTGVDADVIKIVENAGGDQIASGTNVKTAKAVVSKDWDKDYTYSAEAEYKGITFTASATVSARYPIIYGFGTSADQVYAANKRLSARTSAATTYSATASASEVKFYILIPEGISDLSKFTFNGAPMVMNLKGETTLGGIKYKVRESGGTYMKNDEVNVVAS